MDRFDGTAARQLPLLPGVDDEPFDDAYEGPAMNRRGPRRSLRLLQKDIYSELSRRRRRAQIAARHLLDAEP
jgi:hypothetical protein